MDALPLVLKEDVSSIVTEMVYGTTLRLPGEYFTAASAPYPSDYVSQLKAHMQLIRLPPPRPTQRTSQVSEALSTATHVFIRHDTMCKPLQPPYDGSYPVVKAH